MEKNAEDVVAWLWRKVAESDEPDRARYRKAARTIEVLREALGVRDALELQDMEPEGNA